MSINHLQTAQPQTVRPQVLQSQMRPDMVWVQGIEGAKAYLLAPGMTVPLWDSENQCIYIKSADLNGIPRPLTILDYTIRPAEVEPIAEVSSEPVVDTSQFVSKAEFDELKEMIGDLRDSIVASRQKGPYQNNKKGGRGNE